MRIIITSKGEGLSKILQEDLNTEHKLKEEEIKMNMKQRFEYISSRNVDKRSSISSPLGGRGKLKVNQSDISQSDVPINQKDVVKINVNNKISLSKNVIDKYNNDYTSKLILPQFPDSILQRQDRMVKDIENSFEKQSISDLKSLQGIYSRQKLPVKEIINKDSYNKLINSIERKKEMKDKLSHVNTVQFRTPYAKRTNLEEINENLNKMIDCSNTDLIQYLNMKTYLPESLVTNLKRFDEERILKTNKICQKILTKSHNYDDLQIKIRKKIFHPNRGQAEQQSLDLMLLSALKKQKSFHEIIGDYDIKKDRFDTILVQIHKDIKRDYWDRFNSDHLMRKNNRKENLA